MAEYFKYLHEMLSIAGESFEEELRRLVCCLNLVKFISLFYFDLPIAYVVNLQTGFQCDQPKPHGVNSSHPHPALTRERVYPQRI